LLRTTYGEIVARARRLASALTDLGVRPGDRVATVGWNSTRHLELYLAVPAMGAVLHTLNIRLFSDDLKYIAEHAGDRVLFLDASLADVVPPLPGVRHEILMPDDSGAREGAILYEDLVAAGEPGYEFPECSEDMAAAICYTSGTTGRPKGVVYSHRSIALFCLMANQPDAFGIAERDTVMPIVPMFHANAWGMPYIAAMSGAAQVLPGPSPTLQSLVDLIQTEGVTVAAAVPTVWQGVIDLAPDRLTPLREAISGGLAVPESHIRTFEDRWGVTMVQGWGMTETSPLATISRLPAAGPTDLDECYALRARQGRPLVFLDLRIDHEAGGELQVRANTVARQYAGDESPATFTRDGWMRTGNVAEIDADFSVRLIDRTNDLIKSGGEWISSVELESAVLAHPRSSRRQPSQRPMIAGGRDRGCSWQQETRSSRAATFSRSSGTV
jgi:fatty-acyl-CoA synthase